MDIETIEEAIQSRPGALLYFWGEKCNVCHALKPKLFQAFRENFPKIEPIEVDIADHSDIAAHFGVFSIPTAIVFLDGKEFARVSRNVSVPTLVERIRRPYDLLIN